MSKQRVKNILETLKNEDFSGQLKRLYGKSYEEAKQLNSSKMAKVGFETKKDGSKVNRLGWSIENIKWLLDNPDKIAQVKKDADIIRERSKYVIFCGMGGSGLGVEVTKTTFGEKEVKIYSLRTTSPEAIKYILEDIAKDAGSLEAALALLDVVVISKSGTTKETVSHKEFFEGVFNKFPQIDIKEHMWVITDKGSPMDTGDYPQRPIQLNDKGDIGGRYTSPSTYIFLLPLALVAPEKVEKILRLAVTMNEIEDIEKDIYITLGAYGYHMAAELGKDKLTAMFPEELRDVPMWGEQLLEESDGKDGKGITLFYGEDISMASLKPVEENDRVFLRFNIGGKKTNDKLWKYLEEKGYPVFEIDVDGIDSIGGVMLGLQRAVATVGYLWDICFVDQPAVEGYKISTREVMDGLKPNEKVTIPKEWHYISFNKIRLYYDRLIEAGVFTLKELKDEVRLIDSDMEDAPAVYASILKILVSKPGFEAKELGFYGSMTKNMKAILQEARTNIFTNGLNIPSKLGEGPDKNHSYHQNIKDGKNMWLSTYFMPLIMQQPDVLEYDDNLIKAQTIGTTNDLVKVRRKALLIAFDSTTEEAAPDVNSFFKEVEKYLSE
ncbi:hypothetical protein ACFL2G_01665 [Candidatus Omnitrophota bacterium]